VVTRFVHYYAGAIGDSGVTVALWGWASALAAAGFEVLVLHGGANAGERHTAESFVTARDGSVEHRPIAHRGTGRLVRHPVDLGRHLRDGDVLVLHEGWVSGNTVAAVTASRARVPYILVPHGVYEPLWRRYHRPPRAVRAAIERRVLERAAAVHLFFPSEAASIMALAPAARTIVSPTGIEIPSDRWRGGGGYFAWIGRYDPTHKGLDVLVDAVAEIPADRRPAIRLRGYDYRGGLAHLARLLAARPGVDRSIEIGGPISGDEKRRFLLEAEGYLLPSRWESHSVALLEALSLGIPCLVSGTLHVASDLHRNGAAVIAMPDVPSLAAALITLKDAADVGPRGRAMVATEFTWTRAVDDLIRQLETLGLIR
jgi:glycosyltransferase involved in cell wall biosynthesis